MTDIEKAIANEIKPNRIRLSTDRPTESLLADRQTTHGDFESNARISQALKAVIHYYTQKDVVEVHRESLDMIALKISRILSGQSDFAEHWDDIAGYAKLAAKACMK
jgi:hypothetical protein